MKYLYVSIKCMLKYRTSNNIVLIEKVQHYIRSVCKFTYVI